MFIAIALMFSSCFAWAHLIGVFSGVLTVMNPERNAFRTAMDSLNRFIRRESFPLELARRMREYFHQSQHLRAVKAQQEIMSDLPPSLQGEVSWTTNQVTARTRWHLVTTLLAFGRCCSLHLFVT